VEYVAFYAAWNPLKVQLQLGESEVALCQQAQVSSSVYAVESPFYSAVESPLVMRVVLKHSH
jgi:hypothetical protein